MDEPSMEGVPDEGPDEGVQLPLFEGFQPKAATYRLTGTTGLQEDEPLEIGQTIYLLVRARVVGVNHERKGSEGRLTREHKLKLIGADPVDPEEEVAEKIVQDAYSYLASIEDEDPEAPEG